MGRKNKDFSFGGITKLGIFASSLLVSATIAYVYSPVVKTNAKSTREVMTEIVVSPVVSITLSPNNLNLHVTPTNDGAFQSEPLTALVNTNSNGGYELYFSSEDEATDMTNIDTSITDKITSNFSGTVTSTTMSANTWGYSLDDTDFLKIPTLSNQVLLRNIDRLPSESEKYNVVHFGTKVSTDLSAGFYSKSVRFSAIAHNNVDPRTVFDVQYMQDMSPLVCANTTTPAASATNLDWDGTHHGDTSYVPRTTLIDKRDGKKYLISKLADGNCWMSQNLALDLTSGEQVVISNNDGTTSYATPNNTTQIAVGVKWSKADNNWRSYHPQELEAYYVGGITKSGAPTGSGDEYLWESTGNYYNWYAATGGTGTATMAAGDATSSICPKGWRLPTSAGTKSFVNLFGTAYSLVVGTDSEPAGTAFRADPLNFVLAGGYNYSKKIIDHQEENGFYWMSTSAPEYDDETGEVTNTDSAYRMSSKTTYIKPQGTYHKGYGFPVRCVSI
ncbi:hypothetical protein J6W91_00940 [Candidatus Saccharibacteria bacterium]|nr:hypothetical protein [Candidatus Saccharibacteria bacterium]